MTNLNQSRLQFLVAYDPEAGVFTWRNSKYPARNGTRAGKLGDGTFGNYAVLGLDGKQYAMSKLAWLYVHGEFPKRQLKFLNGDPSDFRISNLAERIPKNRYPYMTDRSVDAMLEPYRPSRDPAKLRREHLKSRFNLTPEQFAEKLISQKGVCAICHQPETAIQFGRVMPLSVDHDHVTDAVRDLLCRKCNTGIGCFSDNPALMVSAISYLRRHAGDGSSNIVPLKAVGAGDKS